MAISRIDRTLVGQWWWTIDRTVLGIALTLMFLGLMLSFAASPSVAKTISASPNIFIIRHSIYIIPSVCLMFIVSVMDPKQIRRLSVVLFTLSLAAVFLTLFSGIQIKGAQRWISLAGFSLQPTEFLKPAFIIISAWMLSEKRLSPEFPGLLVNIVLFSLSVGMILLQPDLGTVVLISTVWLTQLFVSGLSLFWIALSGISAFSGLIGTYFFLPHVTRRIDQFMFNTNIDKFGDHYQILQSLSAFSHGGILGVGPGEGIVKRNLPDSHADFVFAVAAEEFGAVFCAVIMGLFIYLIVRSLRRAVSGQNLFCLLAVVGLTAMLGYQALINMASTLGMIPTKGMTLPLLSYGGSSLLAVSLSMGMLLSLTRR